MNLDRKRVELLGAAERFGGFEKYTKKRFSAKVLSVDSEPGDDIDEMGYMAYLTIDDRGVFPNSQGVFRVVSVADSVAKQCCDDHFRGVRDGLICIEIFEHCGGMPTDKYIEQRISAHNDMAWAVDFTDNFHFFLLVLNSLGQISILQMDAPTALFTTLGGTLESTRKELPLSDAVFQITDAINQKQSVEIPAEWR